MKISDLRFVSLGFGNICQVNEIWAVMRIGSAQSRRIIADAKDEDRFFDWTGKRAMRSIILLKNGMVCSSPFSATTLYNRLKAATAPITLIDESRKGMRYPLYSEEYDGAPSDVDEGEDMTQEEVDDEETRIEDVDDSDFDGEDDEDEDNF